MYIHTYIYIEHYLWRIPPSAVAKGPQFFSAPLFQARPRIETELVEAPRVTARGSSSTEAQGCYSGYTAGESGVGKCPFFGDFEHHLQISVGYYIPNSWVMLNWDIYQPLLSPNCLRRMSKSARGAGGDFAALR